MQKLSGLLRVDSLRFHLISRALGGHLLACRGMLFCAQPHAVIRLRAHIMAFSLRNYRTNRLAGSGVEAYILRKVFWPVMIPAKVYAGYRAAVYFTEREERRPV